METTDLEEKLKKTDTLLSTLIQTLNNPKNAKEEVEALAKAVEGVNTAQKEISELISAQKELISAEKNLIENFKPTYEVIEKHYTMNVKEPLYWIGGCILICGFVIMFFGKSYSESKEKDNYYMQYRWLMYYGNEDMQSTLKEMDASYLTKDNKKLYDKEVWKREKEIKDSNEATANAKLQKEASDRADKAAKEAAKKLH